MAYKNNIPQPTDALSQSQADMLNNFAAIQTLIDIDHVDFANSNQGQHNKVTFPVQGSAPSFAAGSVGLYNLAYAATSTNELFINRAAGSNYPMTAFLGTATTGWTYIPSGMIMVWGRATITAGGAFTVLYSAVPSFPGFSSFAATPMLTRIKNSTASNFLIVDTVTSPPTNVNGFIARSSDGQNGVTFGWLVIGI